MANHSLADGPAIADQSLINRPTDRRRYVNKGFTSFMIGLSYTTFAISLVMSVCRKTLPVRVRMGERPLG